MILTVTGRGRNRVAHFSGLSSEAQPTQHKWLTANESTLAEIDTGTHYLWDGASWEAIERPQNTRARVSALEAQNTSLSVEIVALRARVQALEARP